MDIANLMNILTTKSCQNVFGTNIDSPLDDIIHYVYLGIQVVIPILLIIFGMIELGKAITAQKEDEIKKAQASFLKKLILAVIVFLVFSIVHLVFNFAAKGSGRSDSEQADASNVWKCIEELIS